VPIVDPVVDRVLGPGGVGLEQPAALVHVEIELARVHELMRLDHLERAHVDLLEPGDVHVLGGNSDEVVLHLDVRRRLSRGTGEVASS
jgi:hypothetical protein